MEIKPISGGIEYRPEIMTLVLPGDKEYRVRTARTGVNTIVPSSQPAISGTDLIIRGFSNQGASLESQNALALLRKLGDMETEGITLNYPGMDVVDEYAGGHRGIIDIWV